MSSAVSTMAMRSRRAGGHAEEVASLRTTATEVSFISLAAVVEPALEDEEAGMRAGDDLQRVGFFVRDGEVSGPGGGERRHGEHG